MIQYMNAGAPTARQQAMLYANLADRQALAADALMEAIARRRHQKVRQVGDALIRFRQGQTQRREQREAEQATTGEKILGGAKGGMSGAMTGAMFGGPVGAVIGGAVGAGGGAAATHNMPAGSGAGQQVADVLGMPRDVFELNDFFKGGGNNAGYGSVGSYDPAKTDPFGLWRKAPVTEQREPFPGTHPTFDPYYDLGR